jgi:tetratricopeptide (TPR) repeat protein
MGAVNHALTVDPRNARAFLVKSHAFAYSDQLDYRGQIDEAIDAAETAIALDPNLAAAYAWLGRLYAKAGYPERTSTFVEQAMRLSPQDPHKGSWLYISGTSLLQMGDYDQAITSFRRSLVANPSLAISWCNLSAAYLGAGREADARDALAEARRVTARPLPLDLEEQLDAVRVQLALLRNGFWPYTVGGWNQKRVSEALRAFQHHENLPETSILDEITLARLGVAAGADE